MIKIILSLTLLFYCGSHMSAMNVDDDNNKINFSDSFSDLMIKRCARSMQKKEKFFQQYRQEQQKQKKFLQKNFDNAVDVIDMELYMAVLSDAPMRVIADIIDRGGNPIRNINGNDAGVLCSALSDLNREYHCTDLLLEAVDFRKNKSTHLHHNCIEELICGYKKPKKKIKLFKKMIDLGINLCTVDKPGRNHLHTYAFRPPHIIEIAKILIEKGVNINLQDNRGNTPTHCLARSARMLRRFTLETKDEDLENERSLFKTEGLKDTLSLFREKGADFSIENKEGKTPHDVAIAETKAENIKYQSLSCPYFIAEFFHS